MLCVPGRGALDLPAAVVLARLLALRDVGTRILSASSIAPADLEGVVVACQCFARAPSPAYVRIAHRRLRRSLPPNIPVVLALFGTAGNEAQERGESLGAEGVAGNLRETIEKLTGAVTALGRARAQNAAE